MAGATRDDVRELLNYRDAFNLVSDYLNSGEPITEGLIREIHQRLVEDVRGGAAQPGSYRTMQNFVANSRTREVIYTPPPPVEVPAPMRELVEWLRADSDIHPVLVAGVVQFQLVHIHPFVDGNGRASRLLSTLCLYTSGYDFKRLFTLSEFYDRDRSAFYSALQRVREQGMDLTGWSSSSLPAWPRRWKRSRRAARPRFAATSWCASTGSTSGRVGPSSSCWCRRR